MTLRQRALVCILATSMPFQPLAAQPSGIRFFVQVSPISNLVYQLDCLGGTSACSQAAYQALWHAKLSWNAEDQAALERWKSLRDTYRGEMPLNVPKREAAALPWNGPTGVQLEEKFSIATLRATDRASLRSHWEVIVAPTDLPRLEAIIDHFEPRFMNWWRQDAAHDSERFKDTLQHTLARTSIGNTIGSFARFYEVQFPKDYPIYLDLMVRPATDNTHTNGTQIENHAVLEFLPGENVNRRLGVVIHELCHFFYSSGSDSNQRNLTRRFADSPDSLSLAAWNILNEALATALGNGIAAERLDSVAYQKALKTERGLYNNTAIDAAAKGALPFLQSYIASGRTLYDSAFVDGYLGALESGMPELLRMPMRLLTEVTIIHDSEFRDVVEHDIARHLQGGIYVYEGIDADTSWTMLRTYPKLNAMIVVSPKTLPLLAKREQWVPRSDVDAMRAAFTGGRPFVYAIKRFPSTYLFVIGGSSNNDVSQGFLQLLNAPARYTGFLPQ